MRAVSLAHWREQARWTVLDTLVIARRNLLRYIRLPQLLVFSTIQPVMFVLLFAYVFGGAINVGDVDYIDFLLPGILAQTVLFGSIQTGIGLADDLSRGMIERFRSLPMFRSAVLGGEFWPIPSATASCCYCWWGSATPSDFASTTDSPMLRGLWAWPSSLGYHSHGSPPSSASRCARWRLRRRPALSLSFRWSL